MRLDIAYDGAGFSGWAIQRDQRTVQGEVERALAVLAGGPVATTCAGRTDAGVHARGQVVHADVPAALAADADRLARRLGGLLPADVAVRAATSAPPHFDARFGALWRRYSYRVLDAPAVVDPNRRGDTVAHPRPLDLAAMNTAAAGLLGEHDFAAFCRRREGATTIRRLLDYRWHRDGDGVAVATVRADAFCHSMVRALVGALLPVGDGRRTPDWPMAVLRTGQRDPAVGVAPAHGLCLEEVRYPADDALAARVAQARSVRF